MLCGCGTASALTSVSLKSAIQRVFERTENEPRHSAISGNRKEAISTLVQLNPKGATARADIGGWSVADAPNDLKRIAAEIGIEN